MNSSHTETTIQIIISIFFNTVIVMIILDYILHRILYYKQIKMFEKLVFDNHQQFARFADHMNEKYKRFEEKWSRKI